MRYYISDLLGFIDELQRENIRYFANVKEFARKNNILRERVDLLKKENKELSDKVECLGNNNQELLKENGRLKEELQLVRDDNDVFNEEVKQLVEEKKRLQENFEELKASSDLSMSAELAEMFEEFIDKNEKIRDDLSVKLNEFREKYQLK